MRAVVYVTLKKTVLDPQGRTICSSLNELGHESVKSVRQGKYFEIEIDHTVSSGKIRGELEKIAREVLANPIIEEYHIDWKE